jgi:hypothetical protein
MLTVLYARADGTVCAATPGPCFREGQLLALYIARSKANQGMPADTPHILLDSSAIPISYRRWRGAWSINEGNLVVTLAAARSVREIELYTERNRLAGVAVANHHALMDRGSPQAEIDDARRKVTGIIAVAAATLATDLAALDTLDAIDAYRPTAFEAVAPLS